MGRYPWAEFLLVRALHVIICYPTPHRTYRVVVLATIIYVTVQIFLTPEVTDPLLLTYTAGSVIASEIIFTAYLLFTEDSFPNHWRRVRDEVHGKAGAGGSDGLPSNFPFTKKFWWMVDLAHGSRMIGWVQEPRNGIPPHPPPSRRAFIRKTFSKLITNVVISDLAKSVFAQSPAIDSRLHDPTDGPETYLAAVPLLRRAPYILSYAIHLGTSMSALHNAAALVCVGLGQSSPTLWPDMWGRWEDAYTVRRLWGQTWHQQLRPMVTGYGRLVANKILKFPPGTNRSSCTQLYVAFFISGLVHFGGDLILEKRLVYRSFKFFLLQAVAITFEDSVFYIAKRLARRGEVELRQGTAYGFLAEAVARVFGYCWVTIWFCLTLPVWVDEVNAAGVGSIDRGPITQFLLGAWKQWA